MGRWAVTSTDLDLLRCATRSGAIWRSGARRAVYALSETALCALTRDNSDNPTLAVQAGFCS